MAGWSLRKCLSTNNSVFQTVEDQFSGTAYRAANWVCVGVTKGRGKLERRHQTLPPQKAIFLYPLRPDFKDILMR
jgi:hypothetical protein